MVDNGEANFVFRGKLITKNIKNSYYVKTKT